MTTALLRGSALASPTIRWLSLLIAATSFLVVQAEPPVEASRIEVQYPRKLRHANSAARELNGYKLYSNSGEDVANQLKVSPFEVILSPTPTDLSYDIYWFIEGFCATKVRSQIPLLEYLYLGFSDEDWDWNGNRRNERQLVVDESGALVFNAGVAVFSPGNQVPMSEVNRLIKEAINEDLATYLGETYKIYSTPPAPFFYKVRGFDGIETAEYVSRTEAPSAAPTSFSEQAFESINAAEEQVSAGQSSSSILGKVIGCLAGAVLALFVVYFLAKKRRRESQPNQPLHGGMEKEGVEISAADFVVDDGATAAETEHGDAPTELIGDADASEVTNYHTRSQYHQESEHLDVHSVADSEWTMSTIGDRARSDLWGSESGETFERDRQICIQKDMLQTPWSGTQPMNVPKIKPTRNDFQSWRTQEGERPFVFEQANGSGEGEEVYLMPPSRTRSRERSSASDTQIL